MKFYDCHIHTMASHDSRQTPEGACEAALGAGLAGIAFTDHADPFFFDRERTLENIKRSVGWVRETDKRYGGKLRVFHGIEMGEPLICPEKTDMLFSLSDYDVVLGSVHTVYLEDVDDSYSRINFDADHADEGKIHRFLDKYFSQMLDMAERGDFDILTHLSCPLRYLNGKYCRGVTLDRHADVIDRILGVILGRSISLEINTSGIDAAYGDFMPMRSIVERYYALGGRMVTLGSDAHSSDRVGHGLAAAAEMLADIGFDGIYHYENRVPIFDRFDTNKGGDHE